MSKNRGSGEMCPVISVDMGAYTTLLHFERGGLFQANPTINRHEWFRPVILLPIGSQEIASHVSRMPKVAIYMPRYCVAQTPGYELLIVYLAQRVTTFDK